MTEASHEGQLYGMFLTGLLWLRQARPEKLDQRGSSVISSFVLSGFLPDSARVLIEESYSLMDLVQANSVIITGPETPRRSELVQLMDMTEKHNIILAVPDEDIRPEKIFAPRGYCHIITPSGMKYAAHAASYLTSTGRIDYERFITGWEKFKDKMRAIQATEAARNERDMR